MPRKKKVDQIFYNDPERGQQVIERIRKAKEENRREPKEKKTRADDFEIVPDPDSNR